MSSRVTSVGLVTAPRLSTGYCYPDHIDSDSIAALPSKPGIYIFRDALERPLYIGKSVNIRTRVLSHLRTPAEARMLEQTRRVDFQRTAGDIGALLLESRLIKEMQPLYNVKLRNTREMCALRFDPDSGTPAPQVVYERDHDFARTQGLYGLFASKRAAQDKLREIVENHRLCHARTGLESAIRGRACFARQLRHCLGACTGDEASEAHDARLLAALEELRVVVWPYPGPMGIVEECDGWRQTHIVDHWFYLGSIERRKGRRPVRRPARRRFDVDTYKILVKPMLRGDLLLTPIEV
ncbi:excinuclease Cho [Noviherbaspirillum humi]|uniref:Excinuclease cho n=1 Tax=Noviherbaspirillum humi TaxID=1688639 RepID=A0A239HDK7_9BURK|nr:endonuclease [Noviherbaspirillum humi]SNS79241.1 excinuclease Cho [Noviherbaspirillum humi]